MDINDLIRQSVSEVLAETGAKADPTAAPATPAAPPAGGPITVNIQGQPVTFRDQADLEAQLNATAAAIRQQTAAPVVPAPEPTGGRVKDDDGGSSFSHDEYIRLMNKDPREAQNYVLNYTLFDGKVDNAAELLRETMVQTAQANRQIAAFQFRQAHAEIPVDNPQVGGTIEQVRQNLGLPFNAQGLEAAYAYAVQKGALPDFRQIAAAQQNQQQAHNAVGQQPPAYNSVGQPQTWNGQNLYAPLPSQPQYNQQPQQPQNPYLAPPPVAGRSQQIATPVTLDDLDNMSSDQLAALLNKLQSAGING